ncbi:MAG: hypothetical protein QXI19_10155 [Candidatus Caldarchaeum sp.]
MDKERPPEASGGMIHLVVSIGLFFFLLCGLFSLLPWTSEVKETLRRYAVIATLYTPIVATLYTGLELIWKNKKGPGISLIFAVLIIMVALAGGVRW